MKLRQLMTPNPVCLSPESSLIEAARQMLAVDCGFLPVAHNGRIEGVITDRDIVVRGLAANRDPRQTKVRDCMTPAPSHCYEDDDLDAAIRLMENRRIRRVPVLNRNQQLVGVVSIGDLATHARDQRLCGEVLERVSEPNQPRRRVA